jgi:hypothetical protein
MRSFCRFGRLCRYGLLKLNLKAFKIGSWQFV